MALLVIILLYLSQAIAQDVVDEPQECTTCLKVNTTCYNVTYLFDLQGNFRENVVVHKMAVMHPDNILFYVFEPAISDAEYYKVGFINLDDQDVNGVIVDENQKNHNFGTFDIDQDTSTVYLGGVDGIYTYHNAKLSFYSSLGDEILSMFYKNYLYFVKYNDTRIIAKKGDMFTSILDYIPIKTFVVNKDNVIVFLSKYGLFLSKVNQTVWLSKNAFFRGLSINLEGDVYAWWVDGIYKVDINPRLVKSRVVKVAHLPRIGAMTFDNANNILFSSDRALFKLTLTNTTVC